MATAAVLLPKDLDALQLPVPSPSLLTATSQLGRLVQVSYCVRMPLQRRGQSQRKQICRVWGQCGLRKHTTISQARGFLQTRLVTCLLLLEPSSYLHPECSEPRSEGARSRLGQGQTFLNPDQLLEMWISSVAAVPTDLQSLQTLALPSHS